MGAKRGLVMLGAAGLLAACQGEGRGSVDVAVVAAGADGADLQGDGFTAQLTQASLTLTDLRLEEPSDTAAPSRALHPGHDYAGDVAGELLGTYTVDLLAGDVTLGEAICFEGAYATGRFDLVGAPAATLAGTLTLDGQDPLPFSFVLTLDEVIRDIPFDAQIDAAAPPAAVRLSISVAHMLSFPDLSTGDTDGDGALTLADGTLDSSVPFGVESTSAYALTLDP